MPTDRLLSADARPDEEPSNWAMRPESLAEYVGQPELVSRLSIALRAVKVRGEGREPLEHVLLHGPPGLGKTTLAYLIARELGTKMVMTSGPALARATDLVSALTRLERGDVLFIDEIHRLPIAVEEFIYPALEDFRIDVTIDSGLSARTVQVRCQPFTLVGATTRAGLLSAPLRSRFGLVHHLRYYAPEDLLEILRRSAGLLGLPNAASPALETIARRSRGTPRIANRLLRRVRDYVQVREGGLLSAPAAERALELEGVDPLGLDELDRAYLRTIGSTYAGGPVGLETVAATMNQDAGTLEDVVEPYLLQVGFLARTRRGRTLTRAGADHVGVPYTPPADGLFD